MRLKELRVKKGLSQLRLATELNTTQNTISRYETGERQPGIEELIKIAELLYELHKTRVHCAGEPLCVELLKLHHFGAAKYSALGRIYPIEGLPYVKEETVKFMEDLLIKNEIKLIKS